VRGRRFWTGVCCVLILGNLCFIWGNSMLPASASSQLSGGVMRWLGFLVTLFGTFGEKLLRKLAHLAEFASLGFLITAQLRLFRKRTVFVPLLCGLFTACVDECIQLFSPGRAGSLTDVGIDMIGFTAGIILALLGQIILKKVFHLEDKQP